MSGITGSTVKTTATEVHFRPMVESDVAGVEKLVQSAYRGGQAAVAWKNEHDIVRGPRITVDGLKKMLKSPGDLVLVAECQLAESQAPELYGCVLVEQEDVETVVIGMLAVGPASQNMGLGRRLVEAAETAAREHYQARKAHMHVACVRDQLLAWYERLGYRATGEMKPFPGPEAGIESLKDGLHFAVIEKRLV